MKLICIVPSCGLKQRAKKLGLCAKHDSKLRNTGTLEYKRLHDGKAKERNLQRELRRTAEGRRAYPPLSEKRRNKLRATNTKWRLANPDKFRAYRQGRKTHVKRATPPWSNKESLKEFYKNCPPGFHVDHIIPLRGKHISGLHVIENLQYLPALENLRKSNKVS